jgi:tripartite-type tricarboxylate transporter receptor subunit TctC
MATSRDIRIDRRVFGGTLLTGIFVPGFAAGQTTWPGAKPISLVVPFAAGGPTDVLARRYAEFISRDIGQTFIVENVAGAGGTTGSARVAKAKADGYTIQLGQAGTHVSAVGLYKRLAYDPVTNSLSN